jgi:hypothetical protein
VPRDVSSDVERVLIVMVVAIAVYVVCSALGLLP